MYELFELVRLLSLQRQSTRQGPVEVTRFAWRENGESNLLALFCSNDHLLLRWSVSGRTPVVKQLPWATDKRIAAMCFDPTVSWLLIATESPCLYILPALALLNPSARVDQLWSLTDCTTIPVSVQSILCAACWWHTLDDRQVAIVTTKVGELLFVDLMERSIITKITIDIQVSELALIQDDDQTSTSLLMTGVSNGQWKILLEAKSHIWHFSPDDELGDLGYIDIDIHSVPPHSVLDAAHANAAVFSAERIPQSQSWVVLCPQFARGRHFITAHDQKSAMLQVYDSEIQFSPLFVYKLPLGAENVILTDRLTFTLSRCSGSQLLILSNQRAETSSLDSFQDFSEEAVIQRLELPAEEKMLGACHRTFPFYWHDKQEEQQRSRMRQGTVLEQPSMETVAMDPQAFDIPVNTHTVLDGCIVVTNCAVYECRPRASPERLFLQHTVVSAEVSVAEHLAISVGLDITMLAELAAQYMLRNGHVCRAIRLFALSKCSTSRRCASLARYGCLQEMVTLLKQALHNTGLDLTCNERRVLANMLLHCYVHLFAHQQTGPAQSFTAFRDFLLGSFAFDETEALDLLAEYGLNQLLLDFAMGRGLVADALGRLIAKGQLPVASSVLTQLVSRGFSAHVLQAAQGGVLSSLLGDSIIQVLVTSPELVTRNISLVKQHLTSVDLPLLLRLAAILDPSQGVVRALTQRQASTLHRTASLNSVASFASSGSDAADGSQDGANLLCQILEVFILTVLHINYRRGNKEALSAEMLLSDPTYRVDTEGVDDRIEDSLHQQLSLQFSLASCGSHHAAVVRDGDLYTWGRTMHGRLGHGDLVREGPLSGPACVQTFHMLQIRVEAVSCGGEHTLAITQQGLYGWGNSRYGQVGVGTRHVYHRPMLLETMLPHPCVAISCGQYHSLAITTDATAWSWGWGVHGQLGHSDPNDQLTPKVIRYLYGRNIIRAAAGYCHSVVLNEMGEVWTFGCNYFGQLGNGANHKQTTPGLVTALTEPVTVIGTKYFHSIAVTVNNRVFMWGCHPHNLRYAANAARRSRQMGQAGNAPSGDGVSYFNMPILVDTTFLHSKVIQVSCGSLHTSLLTVDGEVYVWGRNLEGQLGTGNRQDERVPKMLTRINDQHIIHLSSGGEFNIAIDSEFSVWVWGKNENAQLGLLKTDLSGQKTTTATNTHTTNATNTKGQKWRKTNLLMVDVVVPSLHRGLPVVTPANQTRWGSPSGLSSVTAAVQDTQWEDEKEGGSSDALLPNLKSLCPGDLPYHAKTIPVVVKYLGDYLGRGQVVQHCVDLQDWFTAAHLCLLEDRHIQALCYRLMGLSRVATELSEDSMADLSSKVVSHHLRLALDDGKKAMLGDHQLSMMCLQIISHWLDHSLPICQLEQLLDPYLSDLSTHLAMLLFSCRERKGGGVSSEEGDHYCRHFSATFCLGVLNRVLTDVSPATQHFLSSWLPDQKGKRTDSSDTGADSRSREGSRPLKKPLPLQPQSNLIPYQRVWQDIMRNVAKHPPSTAAIPLSRNQLDHLQVQTMDGEEDRGDGKESSDAGSVVLFTCGHHFTQAAFTDVVLTTSLKELGSGSSHLESSGKLPATASLLQQYYRRPGLLPLACPKCVLNVLRT